MASMLSKILLFFVILWVGIYLLAYVYIMGPSGKSQQTQNANPLDTSIKASVSAPATTLLSFEIPVSNPFLSTTCKAKVEGRINADKILSTTGAHSSVAAVVFVIRNLEPEDIISSVKSMFANSGGYLNKLILVDDHSNNPVSSWQQWNSFGEDKKRINFIRTPTVYGVAGAKHFGAKFAIEQGHEHVVFVDNAIIVSEGWLVPLLDTLSNHEKAIVYPHIDVWSADGLIEGDPLIGAFDWALNFVWEPLDTLRVPLLPSISTKDSPLPSPAAPGILAMNSKYYNDVGGFESGLRLWGQDSVELSLRVWLCGGEVIKQPCSRVAQKYFNVFKDYSASVAVSQSIVDHNVMAIAERYMLQGTEHKETVFQARFTGRVPYTVDLSQSERFSKHMSQVKFFIDGTCQTFDWFLNEIFPGLKTDKVMVAEAFKQHMSSHASLEIQFAPLIEQYRKKHSDIDVDAAEVIKLDARAQTRAERDIQALHDQFIPKKVPYKQPQDTMDEYAKLREEDLLRTPPPTAKPTFIPIALGLTNEVDEHEKHSNKLRKELLCEDESDTATEKSCSQRIHDDPAVCSKDHFFINFACPKTCGLCGTDGKICFDFYEKKCPEWRDQGRCVEEVMGHVCRRSCNLCTLAPAIVVGNKASDTAPVVPLAPPGAGQKSIVVQKAEQDDAGIDPYTAQKQFSSGSLPDPGDSPQEALSNCALNGKPNGELLARVRLHDSESLAMANAKQFKIFCAVYTYEKNHETNVKATKETWAKRCDGFIAMSTKTDPSIPSINITHEGPEEYDNMWQKSRSIWKYIASRFIDDFDFFLLGGDDMFYIIENLRFYLGTDKTIAAKLEEGKGLFVGRRFFPPKQQVFNSGGAGYILDRAALKILGNHLDDPRCFPHQKGFWEDVNVANCLRVSGGILPVDTRDPLERERFHPFQPGGQLTYRPPKNGGQDWYVDYNPGLKLGYECCSTESISFHYAPAGDLRKLHKYLYHCKPKEQSELYGIVD